MIATNKDQKFSIKIHCVVIGTDLRNNKQYLLSLDEKETVFPSFFLDNTNKSNIEESVVDFLKQYVGVSELELMPQLISLNYTDLSSNNKKKNQINTVYSSLVNQNSSINNAYWVEFDFLNPNKYINLIFEVIQKLK